MKNVFIPDILKICLLVFSSFNSFGLCSLENFTVPSPQQGQCFCNGDKLTYLCTVVGEATSNTFWRGTLCTDVLSLAHILFNSSVSSIPCPSNQNVRAGFVSSINNCYTSELNVTATPDVNGLSVECANGTLNTIGSHIINVAPTSLPSPVFASADVSEQRQIFLTWEPEPVFSVCGGAQYTVSTSCPGCTNRTSSSLTNLTCVGVPTDGTACVISVQTEIGICNTPPSEPVDLDVLLRVSGQPAVRTVPRYNHTSGKLISINATMSTVETFNIIDGFVDGSPVRYEVNLSSVNHSMSTTMCDSATIPITSSLCEGSSCSVILVMSNSCPPSSTLNTTVTAVNRLGPGQPTEVQDGGINTFFNATLPFVLTVSNRDVICTFFESFSEIKCQFFKCSSGTNCRQLELVNEQTGTGNMIIFQLEVAQFQANNIMEFIIRGSSQTKTVDVQGVLMTGADVGTPAPPGPVSASKISTGAIVGIVVGVGTLGGGGTVVLITIVVVFTKKGKSGTSKESHNHEKVELSEKKEVDESDCDHINHEQAPTGDEYAIVDTSNKKKAVASENQAFYQDPASIQHEAAPTGDVYAVTEKRQKKGPTDAELAQMYSVPDKSKGSGLNYASLDMHGGGGSEVSKRPAPTEYASVVN